MDKNKKTKFCEISQEWLVFHKSRVKYNSYEMYYFKVNKLNEYFGQLLIQDIDAIKVQIFLNNLADNDYAKSTIKKYKITLSQIFDYCIMNKLIMINPCNFIELPLTIARPLRRTLTQHEINEITKNVDSINGLFQFVLLYTGLRRSECLALKWEDIDFGKNLIHIYKTCVFNKNIPHIDYRLKNGDDERYIPMPQILRNELIKYSGLSGWIFNVNGCLLTKSQIDSYFDEYLRETGLNFTQHMTRHAYATMLYNAGVDVKTAQKILGHKCITMTLAIYTHLDSQHLDDSLDKLNNYLQL